MGLTDWPEVRVGNPYGIGAALLRCPDCGALVLPIDRDLHEGTHADPPAGV